MSIEIILYPKNATKRAICAYLKPLNYYECSHLWSWPSGSRHFHWFSEIEFESFDGVEATVFPLKGEEKTKHPDCTWALHTRTRASASVADKMYQNETIRNCRKKFGGSFYNDWYGTNRYTPHRIDSRDAVSRGIYLSYEQVSQQISAVRFTLPESNRSFENLIGTPAEDLARADPARVLYNALVPFAVAALEHFFSQCFRIMLANDPNAQEKLSNLNRKVDIVDALAIQRGEKRIEYVVSSWYSFQSINGIHNAFNEWFNLDFWKIIRRRRKVGNRLPFVETQLQQLIEFRHGLVHRFNIDLELNRESILEILDLVMVIIDEFVDFLEKSKELSIRD